MKRLLTAALLSLGLLGLSFHPVLSQGIERRGSNLNSPLIQGAVSFGPAIKYLTWSSTAPTIAGQFGTSSSITVTSGTPAFKVTTGSSGPVSTGTVTMPAATTGWACAVADITTPAANMTQQTGSTSTTVVVTNYVRTTGVAGNWPVSDVLVFNCAAY